MKIYLIMPVRSSYPEAAAIAQRHLEDLELEGHTVHFPPRDAPQADPTGRAICETHLQAMRECDVVHILWDIDSKGSHFDLGMAYALGKPIKAVMPLRLGPPGKSYWKAVIETADPAARGLRALAIDAADHVGAE